MPLSQKKKKKKKKFQTKKQKKYAGVVEPPHRGWPATLTYIYIYLKNKICDGGILGKKGSKWSNCHNLKVFWEEGGGGRGKVSHLKL